MTPLLALIVVATALNGILGGLSFEIALVKLPTRHRIGSASSRAAPTPCCTSPTMRRLRWQRRPTVRS